MTNYVEPTEKPNAVEVMHAQSAIGRISKYGAEVMRSAIDRVLRRQLNPNERSAAYILHSMNVLIEAGMGTEEMLEKHSWLVTTITELKSEMLDRMDKEGG